MNKILIASIFCLSIGASSFAATDCGSAVGPQPDVDVLVEVESTLQDLSELQRQLQAAGVFLDLSSPIPDDETGNLIYLGMTCESVDYFNLEFEGLVKVYPNSNPTPL